MFQITIDPNTVKSIVALCKIIGDPRRYAGESWDLDKIEAMITEYHKISSFLTDAEYDLISIRDQMALTFERLGLYKARTTKS